jgi:hypothetical protein
VNEKTLAHWGAVAPKKKLSPIYLDPFCAIIREKPNTRDTLNTALQVHCVGLMLIIQKLFDCLPVS